MNAFEVLASEEIDEPPVLAPDCDLLLQARPKGNLDNENPKKKVQCLPEDVRVSLQPQPRGFEKMQKMSQKQKKAARYHQHRQHHQNEDFIVDPGDAVSAPPADETCRAISSATEATKTKFLQDESGNDKDDVDEEPCTHGHGLMKPDMYHQEDDELYEEIRRAQETFKKKKLPMPNGGFIVWIMA